MFVAHARCLRTHMAVLRKDSRIDTHGSKHFFQHLFVVIARAENRRNLLCKIDDGGFEADLASPPSMIQSILSPRSSITCSAFVGLGRPDVLALGAAMKPPPAKISAFATLLLG